MPNKKRGNLSRKKDERAGIYDIASRYFIILLSSVGNLWIFYFVFAPLTLYPVAFLLKSFYDITVAGHFIFINKVVIEISKACVAGSAYYLLFMLNFITRGIRLKKRALIFLFTSFLLLGLNIIRIIILSLMKINDIMFFEQLHIFFWYFVSVVYVFVIWIIAVKVFKIESTPFYSDFLYLRGLGRNKKKVVKKLASRHSKGNKQ